MKVEAYRYLSLEMNYSTLAQFMTGVEVIQTQVVLVCPPLPYPHHRHLAHRATQIWSQTHPDAKSSRCLSSGKGELRGCMFSKNLPL